VDAGPLCVPDARPRDDGAVAEPEVTVAGTGGVAEGGAAGAEAAW
jgi:hypothetical protein